MNRKSTTVSYMCTGCNDFPVFNINIFDFSGNRERTYKCDCEHSEIKIIKNSIKSFKIEFECPVCNEKHSYIIPKNQFWSDDVFTFSCPFYEANILYVGSRNKLEETVRDYIKNELPTYEAPSFMPDYSTIEKLIAFTKKVEENPKEVKFCECDSTYSTAFNEKAVYVICDSCEKSMRIGYEKLSETNL